MADTTTIEALKKKHNKTKNVRKALNVLAFVAPLTTAVPDALTGASGAMKELPADWTPLGIFTTDGGEITPDVSVDDVDGLGYAEPVRSDLTKATKTIKLNIFELFRKEMLSLTHGIDLSQVKANATTGEVVFDDPLLPSIPEKRLLLVAADGPADDEWLMGWCFTRAKLVSMPTISLKATDPITGTSNSRHSPTRPQERPAVITTAARRCSSTATSRASASDTYCGRGPGTFSLRPLPANHPRRTPQDRTSMDQLTFTKTIKTDDGNDVVLTRVTDDAAGVRLVLLTLR